jgi:hypothetical protein
MPNTVTLPSVAYHQKEQPMTREKSREQAIPYISVCVDDALAERSIDDMPADAHCGSGEAAQ